MPTPREHLLAEVRSRLGYQNRGLLWAKIEILLGLLAVGIAAILAREPSWIQGTLAVLLLMLGGYLTLAGHRSHLYQCATEQTALLIEEIRRLDNDTQVLNQRR